MNYNTDESKKSMAPEEAAKPSYWAVLPAQVRYDPEIPANAKLLYAEISSLTDARGYCWASNAYFERLYDLSERTIVRLIRALEQAGYIRILDAGGGSARRKIAAGINPLGTSGGERIATAACALPRNDGDGEPSAPPDKNVSTPLTKMSVPPDKNVTQIKKSIKKENDPPKAPQGAGEAPKKKKRQVKAKAACEYEPELFERFWKLYPRGEAKAEARYEWDELRPDLELMRTMSAVLKRQKVSDEWRRDGGRAIPYACRWLSRRRWEDDPEKIEAAEPSTGSAGERAAEGVGPYGRGSQEEEAGTWL